MVAIEYDSEYYHRGRENRDRKKSGAIRAAGHLVIRIREAPLKPLHPDDVEVTTDNAYVMAASVLTRMIDRSWLDPIATQAARHYVSSGTERGSALAKKMLSDLDDRGPR